MLLFCEPDRPQSVAGNGTTMAGLKSAPRNRAKSSSKSQNLKSAARPASEEQPVSDNQGKPEKKRGRKSRGSQVAAMLATPEPATAGLSLRNAINVAVASESAGIAGALVRESLGGNVSSAKLLIDITGAKTAVDESKKVSRLISFVNFVRDQPEWQPPLEPNVDVRVGGHEPEP
jgi:hypothetical protein